MKHDVFNNSVSGDERKHRLQGRTKRNLKFKQRRMSI